MISPVQSHYCGIYTKVYYRQKRFSSTITTLLYTIHSSGGVCSCSFRTNHLYTLSPYIDHYASQGGARQCIFYGFKDVLSSSTSGGYTVKLRAFHALRFHRCKKALKSWNYNKGKRLKRILYLQVLSTNVAGTAVPPKGGCAVCDFPLHFWFWTLELQLCTDLKRMNIIVQKA